MSENEQAETGLCPLCLNTKSLTQRGIFRVYLMVAKFPLTLMILGIIGAAFYSHYFFILFLMGLFLPLVMADFRMYLYPVAAASRLFGKNLNCPKCEPLGNMYRHQ